MRYSKPIQRSQKIMSYLLVMALCLSGILLPSQPIFAQDEHVHNEQNSIYLPFVTTSEDVRSQIEAEIEKAIELAQIIEPYIEVTDDGQVSFTAVSAASMGLEGKTYEGVLKAVDMFNNGGIGLSVVGSDQVVSAGYIPNPGGYGYFDANRWGINIFWSQSGTNLLKYMVTTALTETIAVFITVVGKLLRIPFSNQIAKFAGWVFGYVIDQLLIGAGWPDMFWLNIPPDQYDSLSDLASPYDFHAARWRNGIDCNGQWQRYRISRRWWEWRYRIQAISHCWDVVWPLW